MTSSKILDLTNDEVYYGNEANWQYMSVSQYKKFIGCEARAIAELNEEWEPTSNPLALLVGNYVHSYFESKEAHLDFIHDNQESIYKKATKKQFTDYLDHFEVEYKKSSTVGDLETQVKEHAAHWNTEVPHGDIYSDFVIAEQMIKRIEKDEFFQFLWQGEKETVVTGELYGVEWKGKIDLLNVEKGYFVDLKTSRGFDNRYWDKDRNRYVSFVEAFGYVIQMGIYEKLLEMKYGKAFTGYIIAVSKETPSNIEAIQIEPAEKEFDLGLVQQRIGRVEQVKTGQEKPRMCGKCEYCREHKQLAGFKYPGQLIE